MGALCLRRFPELDEGAAHPVTTMSHSNRHGFYHYNQLDGPVVGAFPKGCALVIAETMSMLNA
jgi:hypothetical protein